MNLYRVFPEKKLGLYQTVIISKKRKIFGINVKLLKRKLLGLYMEHSVAKFIPPVSDKI